MDYIQYSDNIMMNTQTGQLTTSVPDPFPHTPEEPEVPPMPGIPEIPEHDDDGDTTTNLV